MASTQLVIVKLVFIFGIYILAFVVGTLPNIIPWCKKSVNVLGIANAFSGGVFLAIAFMHILPEVASSYAEYMEKHEDDPDHLGHDHEDAGFPLPFALVFVGYSFILLIDKVIFDTHSLVGEHHHGHSHDPVQASFINNAKKSFIQPQCSGSMDDGHDHNYCINESTINQGIKDYLSKNEKFAVRMSVALGSKQLKKQITRTFAKQGTGLDEDDEQAELFADKSKIDLSDHKPENEQALVGNKHSNGHKHSHGHSHHDHDHKGKKCTCNLTPVVLMIALSTHAIFEGIATGLASNLENLWTFVIAICLHKWAEAMSLGISMSKNFKDEKRTMYVLLAIFSFATPLGVIIGMLVSGSSELTDIIFSSLAGGSFIYISCSEVIVEEFSTPDYKWLKMIFFVLGAGMITSLNFLE